MLTCQSDFEYIRHILLEKSTIPEYQIVSRIAKTIDTNSANVVENPLVKARLNKQNKFDSNLIIHYTHEKRFQSNTYRVILLLHITKERPVYREWLTDKR